MTADEFTVKAGYSPINDDLERANCPRAGEVGHWFCGICRHGTPLLACVRCQLEMVRSHDQA